MSRVRWVGQALGVLALAVGVVAMHAFAGGHGTHAPAVAVTQSDHASATAHAHVLAGGPASIPEVLAVPCSGDCSPLHGGVLGVCLMVLTTVVVLLLRGPASGQQTVTRAAPVQRVGCPRPRCAPPPSRLVLCISRI